LEADEARFTDLEDTSEKIEQGLGEQARKTVDLERAVASV
jgi:hypothetical protein